MEGNAENIVTPELKGTIVVIPSVDPTLSKEGYSADAKVVGEALNARVKTSDIVDDLTSESIDKPLSARQGKVIKQQLDTINLSQAGTVGYNNATSGLEATNAQSAIDEVAGIAKGALPKTGGMLEGALNVRSAENGYSALMKNHSATVDYGTQIADVSKDGKQVKLSMSSALGTFNFVDVDGNIRDIHHEGNKPFGNYTGNGTASPRTIATKGIGRLLVVYSDTRLSFVTPKGAFTINISAGTFEWIDGSKVHYLNGNLNIESTSVAFNASNTTYYYQVI